MHADEKEMTLVELILGASDSEFKHHRVFK